MGCEKNAADARLACIPARAKVYIELYPPRRCRQRPKIATMFGRMKEVVFKVLCHVI